MRNAARQAIRNEAHRDGDVGAMRDARLRNAPLRETSLRDGHLHDGHLQAARLRDAPIEAPSCARGAVRRQALARLFSQAAACALTGALAGVLTGCGGGGGSEAAVPSPPAATPSTATPMAAVLSVPTPVGYDDARLAAFNRLNEIRLSAGLGMLAQNTMLDQAAQAHAEWEVANDVFSHVETAGTTGFTGENWWNRSEALGYTPLGGAEVLSSGQAATLAVDGLANVVYHRSAVLAFEPVDVGIGWSSASASNVALPLVIEITRPATDSTRYLGQSAQASIAGVERWPRDGATGVAMRMGAEIPNPVPGTDVRMLGTPASLTVASESTLETTSFVLARADTGTVVATALLTNANDPNALIPPSFVAVVPLSPLQANTSYVAAFSGTVAVGTLGAAVSLSRSWTFTTGSD